VSEVGQYIWDEGKRAANLAVHGIDFAQALQFEWDTALIAPDTRHDYGESRFIAVGRIGPRLHVIVFTPRAGKVRLISLRKANKREIQRYEEENEEG
jgi:hypothetical protein